MSFLLGATCLSPLNIDTDASIQVHFCLQYIRFSKAPHQVLTPQSIRTLGGNYLTPSVLMHRLSVLISQNLVLKFQFPLIFLTNWTISVALLLSLRAWVKSEHLYRSSCYWSINPGRCYNVLCVQVLYPRGCHRRREGRRGYLQSQAVPLPPTYSP